jgi:amino acid transporter
MSFRRVDILEAMDRLAYLLGVFLIPLCLTACGIRAHKKEPGERRKFLFWLLMSLFWLVTGLFWFFSIRTALDG